MVYLPASTRCTCTRKAPATRPSSKPPAGHFAPHGNPHGFDDAKGPHAGDMPNLVVGKDGALKIEVVNANLSLGSKDDSVLRPGGTALMIHEKADDYKSQPAGNAGGRLACGVIQGR